MNWPDSISDALPPERDDEPANLRGDIADELADHLASAMSQELSRTGDEEAARRKVLERFGDPGQIARRLWWDSMGAKIMEQRILVGAVCVMALASLAACALVWQSSQENSRINQAILARLEPPATTSIYDSPVTLEVQCLHEGAPNEPVLGGYAELIGPAVNPGNNVTLKQSADESGNVRFSPLRPGEYGVILYAESEQPNAAWTRYFHETYVMLPGRDRKLQILCPSPPLSEILSFKVEWNKILPGKDAVLICKFGPHITYTGEWVVKNSLPYLVLNKDGRILSGIPPEHVGQSGVAISCRYRKLDVKESADIRYLVGSFTLERITIMASEPDRNDPELLVGTNVAEFPFDSVHQPTFKMVEGKPNVWTIKLPSENERWNRYEPSAE